MGRIKRKKIAERNHTCDENNYSLRTRRSSMRVNLSFMSNLSDSEDVNNDDCIPQTLSVQNKLRSTSGIIKNSKLNKTNLNNDQTTPVTSSNSVMNSDEYTCNKITETLEGDNNSLNIIKEKEQELQKSCIILKDAIIHKTQTLFAKENELAIKISKILTGNNVQQLSVEKTNSVDLENTSNHNRSKRPSTSDTDCIDCNQGIVTTPKKSRTENSVNGKNSFDTEGILTIPIVRLFADDNDPNNSMSGLNPLHNTNNLKNISKNNCITNTNVPNNTFVNPKITNEFNYTTSPILSQGKRRSKLSKLSLTKKLTQSTSHLSTKGESFINRIPLTCSSFIEHQDKSNSKIKTSIQSKTITIDEKNESSNNCDIITLLSKDNETINIENTTNLSSMEITAVSSNMPIICKLSEQGILNVDKVANGHENKFIEKQMQHIQNYSNNLNKENDNLNKSDKNSDNSQEDCSLNTVHTSLNVNTSLDRMNSNNQTLEKKRSSDLNKFVSRDYNTQSKNSTTIQMNTSIDSVRKSRISSTLRLNKKNIKNMQNMNAVEEKESNKGSNDNISHQSSSSVHQVHNNEVTDTRSKVNNNQTNDINDKLSQYINAGDNQVIQNIEKTFLQQPSNVNDLQNLYNKGVTSQRPSTNTVRSSMQVNTSLDSVKKSPILKNTLDFKKILSMVQDNSPNNDLSDTDTCILNQSSDSDSDIENISLADRIRNITVRKMTTDKIINSKNKDISNKKSTKIQSDNSELDHNEENSGNKNSVEVQNSSIDFNDKTKNTTSVSQDPQRIKKYNSEINVNLTTNESSIIEATPYPASRSVLLKEIIKNNIAANTINIRRFVDFSDNEDSNNKYQTIIHRKKNSLLNKRSHDKRKASTSKILDTVILNTSEESINDSNKTNNPVIIEESLNETNDDHDNTKNSADSSNKQNSKKILPKRKLYPLRESSQLISFSPTVSMEMQNIEEPVTAKKKKRGKLLKKKKQENKTATRKSSTSKSADTIEQLNDDTSSIEEKPKKKKPRKIRSKKIVVKKAPNTSIMKNILQREESSKRLSDRNSLGEFDLRRLNSRQQENTNIKYKMIIVATGLTNEEKNSVKSVIKFLGGATLQVNVTSRTTHIVSSGLRTINLLKGILRGCWLLSLEWVLKSFENKKWLDPTLFEMVHFSKAAQQNRRDRQLFGKVYVPDLFVTCGLIYIENGTSPPAATLKDLVKIGGGRIIEDYTQAEIIIGVEGLREIWILDSITTGEIQPIDQYKRRP